MNRRSDGRAIPRRRLGAAVVVAALLVPAPAPAAGGGLRAVGSLPIAVGSAVVADAATRRVIEIGGQGGPLTLTAYDADRLVRTDRESYDGRIPQAGSGGRPRVYAFDERARALWVVSYASAPEQDNTVNAHLVAIDVDTFAVERDLALVGVFPPGVRILGMRLMPGGRVMLLGQAVPAASAPLLPPAEAPRATGVLVAEIDARAGSVTWGPVPVRGCQSAITNQAQSGIGFADGTVFIGCATPQVLAVPLPGAPAIATIAKADPNEQHLHFLPGSYATGDIYEDARARRLLIVGAAANRPAQAVWVFDLAHRSFVGQVAAGDANVLGAGVDPVRARLYVGIDGAVLITTDRGFEIPQATSQSLATNLGPITAIPFANRVLIPMQAPGNGWMFTVFEDTFGSDLFVPGAAPDVASLDALTADTPQFAADAQAFGARVHEIGGINAVLQNLFPLRGNYWRDPGTLTGLRDGDRDLLLAVVRRAHLSDAEASGEATGADPDPNTESDQATLARATGIVPEGWPYEVSGCNDFGAGATDSSVDGASAWCDLHAGTVLVEGSHDGVSVPGVIAVGPSASRAVLDGTDGLRLRVTAEVRDVVLPGGVEIGLVRSMSVVGAAGERGSARASYTRTFRNVRAGGFSCEAECDVSEVLAALTDVLGVNVRVELPRAEEVATPRGAHAHVAREIWAHREDVVVNNQDPTATQVPALRLTFINDNTLASRAIVELAATKADATSIRIVPAGPLPPDHRLPRVVIDGPPRVPADVPIPPPERRPPSPGTLLAFPAVGWALVALGSPGMVARAFMLWLVLLVPVFLAIRARALGVVLRG